MYRRPKFLEILIEIREEMAREADYDVDLFAEHIRSGIPSKSRTRYKLTDTAPEKAEPAKKKKAGRSGIT